MTRVKTKQRISIILYILAALILAVIMVQLCGCGPLWSAGKNADADASAEQAAAATVDEDEDVDEELFTNRRPELVTTKCKGTSRNVVLRWERYAGAEKYLVFQSETADGEYTLLDEVEQPEKVEVPEEIAASGGEASAFAEENGNLITYRTPINGTYFYRIRAVRGDQYSRWSLKVQICGISGYIKKMYYDDYGQTHFVVSVTNHTDQPMYLYGSDLYDTVKNPHYKIVKFNMATSTAQGAPYPKTATLKCERNGAVEIPPQAKEQEVDLYVTEELPKLGETGIMEDDPLADGTEADDQANAGAGDEAAAEEGAEAIIPPDRFEYRVEMQVYPEMKTPTFKLVVTADEKISRSVSRIVY